jgi:hypothetical protein
MATEAILKNLVISNSKATAKKLAKQGVPADIIRNMSGTEACDSGLYNTHVIPVNCFPLEYELGQTGIPLHRIITIQGATASAKSSMFWFFARAFLQNGGLVIYFDLEGKHEPRTAQAYVGNPIAYRNRVHIFPASIVECFSVQLSSLLTSIRKDKELRKRPILLGIDTLGSALAAKHISDIKQGKADPGYSTAKGTYIQQIAIQTAISMHLSHLPLTIIGLQQERKMLENPDEIKASGGSYNGYAKSLALRMQKFSRWRKLDEELPLIRLSQAKNSNNTQRWTSIVLPCDVNPSGLPIRSYSFQWSYAMMSLLADLTTSASSCLDGIFRVEKPTEKSFAIKAKRGDATKWLDKYGTKACSYRDVGPQMLADMELLDALRVATNLNIEPSYASPYSLPLSLNGGLWLGPEEDPDWDKKSEAEIVAIHKAAMAKYEQEDEEARKAPQIDDDESESDADGGGEDDESDLG